MVLFVTDIIIPLKLIIFLETDFDRLKICKQTDNFLILNKKTYSIMKYFHLNIKLSTADNTSFIRVFLVSGVLYA
jgi:hypothetical protein